MRNTLVLTVLIFSTSLYSATEMSLGIQLGLGNSILRDNKENIQQAIETHVGDNTPNVISFNGQLDIMVQVIPYLAIETGIGYDIVSSIEYINPLYKNAPTLDFTKTGYLSVPLMIRGQYEYNTGVAYASAGLRYGFSIFDLFEYKFYSDLDAAFSIGNEFKLGKSDYIGIRVNYYYNIFTTREIELSFDSGVLSPYQDEVYVAITYRHVFGRKAVPTVNKSETVETKPVEPAPIKLN